jgi:hypothetical protein
MNSAPGAIWTDHRLKVRLFLVPPALVLGWLFAVFRDGIVGSRPGGVCPGRIVRSNLRRVGEKHD